MEFIDKILLKDSDFKTLFSDIEKERLPLACTGLSHIHKAAVLAAVLRETGRRITVVTQDEASALELVNDAKSLGIRAVNFPLRDYCIGAFSGYSKEYEHKRTDTLSALADGAFDLLCVSVDAALQYTVPPEILCRARFTLKTAQEVDTKDLMEKLLTAGYVRSELCEGKGQFSQRGGIIDVFPVNSQNPCRIEFWGDEIDNISFFDIETQRRTENTESIEITPACEVLYNPEELAETLGEYLKTNKKLTPLQSQCIGADIAALQNGISVSADRYIPLIYNGETVFDYVLDTLLFVSESGNITERLKSIAVQQSADIESYLKEGFLSSKTASLGLDSASFWACLEGAVILENFPRTAYELKIKDIINFNFKRSTPWGGDLNVLLEDISYITEQKGAVVILAG
ncbi:MAG: hypothetical protein IKB45_04425, partial [Clostridia bacterium]|nr:hypothetical protein [Clostridia bacterium]